MSITVTAAVSGLACVTESRFQPQLWVRPQLRTNQSGAPVAGDRGEVQQGQRPAGRLSAYLSTKTKLSLKKQERHSSSLILFFCVFSKSSFKGFANHSLLLSSFLESFYVIKMAAELDFGCVHSPTGTEQEGSKVRGCEVMRREG